MRNGTLETLDVLTGSWRTDFDLVFHDRAD